MGSAEELSLLCQPGALCVGTWSDGTTTCAGVGIGLQGAGACRNAATNCVTIAFGFERIGVCEIVLP